MIQPKFILKHPTRPTLLSPEATHEVAIPVEDQSTGAAIIDLTIGGAMPVTGYDAAEMIQDIHTRARGND